ncbi:hypothetical protein [Cryobacterium sp. PAMC25264]|uniref:hypothetical protein n=1 Tax=Cryobacterium sp. PAMC25264 TaxID=2861288 RepID=UPI001C62545C|nr:hypothetical protein [Cryobacterium sp. PAMC25264]QYF74869.1 hypothetical protein KY500_06965 [Cryobacterium sp. PAMC25264]
MLSLILLQIRIGRPTLITELTRTLLQLSPWQRTVLHLTHDGMDDRVYERIWSALQRLIALVDEFPGRRDKVLTEGEYRRVKAKRDPADCAVRRTRMWQLANDLVHGSWLLLPKELRDRSDGNHAIDATFVPLQGKVGNPSSRNLEGNRRTANPDGGFYRREGSHGAVTHADARAFKKTDSTRKQKGRSVEKLLWGVEIEIARLTPNQPGDVDQFPLLSTALGFHIPGAIIGEGLNLLTALAERDRRINFVIMDRAYSGAKYAEFQVPARKLGAKLVCDYKDTDLGVKAHDPRGFIQVSGTWYLDNLPEVLRNADKTVQEVRKTHGENAAKLAKAEAAHTKDEGKLRGALRSPHFGDPESGTDENPTLAIEDARKKYGNSSRVLHQAETLYAKQLGRRELYRLKAKGRMNSAGTRRYTIPTEAPGYASWKLKPKAQQGQSVLMELPTAQDDDPNAGGLKHEQYYPYGDEQWRTTYSMRNGVESANRNLKRSQYEDIANPDKRAVRGNTFTYIVVALASVVENMRQMLSFYKRKLSTKPVTPKNRELPGTFWQSAGAAPISTTELQPPG